MLAECHVITASDQGSNGRRGLRFLAAVAINVYRQCVNSEEEDGAPSSQHPPSTAGPSHPTLDHGTEGVDRADCMETLRRVWTSRVRVGLNSSKNVDVRLDDQVIRKLELTKRRIHARKKDTDTSFSAESPTLIVQVLDKGNGMSIPNQYHAWRAHTKCEIRVQAGSV